MHTPVVFRAARLDGPRLRGFPSRGFGVLATVTVALGLSGCATVADLGSPAAELRAAADADLLTTPPEQIYDVTSVQLVSPIDTSNLADDVHDRVQPSGYLVLDEGVITAAELTVQVAGLTEASFVLTEPAVLRREGRIDAVVYAIGTLSVNGFEQHDTNVRLHPHEISDTSADFTVSFAVPGNPLTVASGTALDEVAARVELAAR